jgi:hypothetical protein
VSDGPGDYADNAQCTWRITAAGPITVVFKAFATESRFDFMKLVDGTGGEVRYSGFVVPPPFSTNSTSLTIVFTSNDSGGSSGFELEVFALVPGGTWAPTAALTTAEPNTAVPTAAPTIAPPVATLAPDIPGTPSALVRKSTRALRHTRTSCTYAHTRARGCKTH